jgi:hypothetical protein
MPRDPERMAQAGLIDRSGEIFFTSSRSVSSWRRNGDQGVTQGYLQE